MKDALLVALVFIALASLVGGYACSARDREPAIRAGYPTWTSAPLLTGFVQEPNPYSGSEGPCMEGCR